MSLIDTAISRLQGAINALTGKTDDLERRVRALEAKERPGVFNNVFVGTSALVNGLSRLTISGANASSAGPHMEFFTGADVYPLFAFLPWTHDNISIIFDAYFDGTNWKSSDANSNYRIAKLNDLLRMTFAGPIAQGSNVTWSDGITMDVAGQVGIPTIVSGVQLTADGVIRSRYGASTRYRLDLAGANGVAQITSYDDTGAAYINLQLYHLNLQSVANTALTTTQNQKIFYHRTSGTPGVGFGHDMLFLGDTNGGVDKNMHTRRITWATATDGSQKARVIDYVNDNSAGRECLRLETSGTAAMIGFLGAAAVVRQNITGVRTGTLAQLQTVVANLLTGLANLGLITDSTT